MKLANLQNSKAYAGQVCLFIYHILQTKYGPCRRGQYRSKFFYIHTLPLQYTFTAEQNSCTLKIREKQGTNTGKEADLSDKKRV